MTERITLTQDIRKAALLFHRDGCRLDCACDVLYREAAIETWVSARVAQAKAEALRDAAKNVFMDESLTGRTAMVRTNEAWRLFLRTLANTYDPKSGDNE